MKFGVNLENSILWSQASLLGGYYLRQSFRSWLAQLNDQTSKIGLVVEKLPKFTMGPMGPPEDRILIIETD